MHITQNAITKIQNIMDAQSPRPSALRLACVGGGCSGLQYHMAFINEHTNSDNKFTFGNLEVYVDMISLMYLKDVSVDYVESLESSGFKFLNPNVKSTCGCGSSFNV
jgi:iron-sulfur cluster assembly accessory protein